MIDEWDVEIPTLSGDKKRRAYVYLPVDYEYNEDRYYPVMYMFDGHNLFYDYYATYGKCWGLKDYLDSTGTPLIIAAVECNTEGNNRLSEYSPVDFDFYGERIKGRGKRYMDWLVKSFKPYIDANLRTLPDRLNTAIGGSSMGGLMTLYAISKYNRYFSRGAALSPSLWANGGDIPEFIKNGSYGKNTVLYMDYGSKEFVNHSKQKEVFTATGAYLLGRGVNLTLRVVPGGTHSEASWERQVPFFMSALGFEGEI